MLTLLDAWQTHLKRLELGLKPFEPFLVQTSIAAQ